jgi:trimeric autotransporter adhesin
MSDFKIYNTSVDQAVSQTLAIIENEGLLTTGWGLSGNVATVDNFIGTINDVPLKIKVNNDNAGIISYDNTALGVNALLRNETGTENTAFGIGALCLNESGNRNSAFGSNALLSNTIGNNNTAFGKDALQSNISGNGNIAFGSSSMRFNEIGSNNMAFGTDTLALNISGNNNNAFGSNALASNISGSGNVSFGAASLYVNENGYSNVAVGNTSLFSNISGYNNTCLGSNSGSNIITGLNNTCIGFQASASAVDVMNEITLGNDEILYLRCNTNVISSLSDIRDKKDVNLLKSCLNIVESLKPVTFKWDKRDWYDNGISDGSKKEEKINVGFVAQDLKELQEQHDMKYLNLVYESNPEKLEATYGNLLPPIIKAVQELIIMVKDQQQEIDGLKGRL